ncbi:MAG TPA: hypothetical protein VMD31_06310 [Opitutaceae bacterium]|nr:hypothetical protein [Opitutaceae bacterium]
MNHVFWIIVTADVLGFALLVWGMAMAPAGYEDDLGFHAGSEPVPIPVDPSTRLATSPESDELAA